MATIRKRGQSWQVQIRKHLSSSINRTLKRKSVAESWARQLNPDIERLRGHKLTGLALDKLTPGQIATYRDERLSQVGAQSVRDELNLIRHVLNIARREWKVPLSVNPVASIKLPSPPTPDGMSSI